jgi:hypothetical protein
MRGWIVVSGGPATLTVPIYESISELESFLKKDVVQYQPGKRYPITDIILSGSPQRIQVSTSGFRRIIEHVRDRLSEWAVELEKGGVLGDNMAFNEGEKHTAQNITVNIEKFTGTLGNISHSQFAIYDYSSIYKTIKECGVPVEERNQLEEIMDGLKEGDAKEKARLAPEREGLDREEPGVSGSLGFGCS